MAAKTSAAKNKVPVAGKRAAKRSPWKRRLKIFGLSCFLVFGTACIAGFGFFWSQLKWASDQLNASLAQKLNFNAADTTVILARDGKTVLYTASLETRDPIESFKEIPANVINATLAAEDRRFFEHQGVDYTALVRSFVTDVREHRTAEGGSTITMQLVKRLYTSPEKTMSRKIKDVALAIELEKRLTKQEILTDYLNQVYYGQGAYGIKAASEVYFGKSDLKKLTIGEAALLARLVRRPSDENPFKDRKKAISNRNDVLATELQMGWIDKGQYKKALHEKLHLAPKHFGSGETIYHAPYFVRYVLDTLHHDMPDIDFKAGGYTIETTLDPSLERVTERQVRDVVEANRRMRVTTGACLLMNSDGEILAMVGGVDFLKHQYNAVTQGRRQPGSSFKPVVYSAALSTGAISPGDSISSGPFDYHDPYTGQDWTPHNDAGFGGYVSIASAIALSINTAAARVCQKVGPETVVQFAHDVFGYTSPLQPVMSIALGSQAVSPMEQAQAYSVFMLHGDRATPFGITQIIGPDDQVVKSYGPDIHKNMLFTNVADQMNQYLTGVVQYGTATRARVVKDARGKTGTTEDNRDAWFCGYTNNLLAVAWVANEHHNPNHNPPYYYDPMPHVWGGTVATEIWVGVMKAAQAKYGLGQPQAPQQVDRNDATTRESGGDTDKPIHTDTSNSDNGSSNDNTDSSDSGTQDQTQIDGNPPDNTDSGDQNRPGNPGPPPVPTQPDQQAPNPATTPVSYRASKRRLRTRGQQMVAVEICAESGLRATAYCPETVTKLFVKGTEPTRYCTIHHP